MWTDWLDEYAEDYESDIEVDSLRAAAKLGRRNDWIDISIAMRGDVIALGDQVVTIEHVRATEDVSCWIVYTAELEPQYVPFDTQVELCPF